MNIAEYAFVGQSPELSTISVGGESKPLCKLRLSFPRSRKRPEGGYEQIDQVWLNGEAWGPLAEDISRLIVKGDRVWVRGQIKDASWTDDAGKGRFGVDLVVHDLALPARALQAVVRRPRSEPDDEGAGLSDEGHGHD